MHMLFTIFACIIGYLLCGTGMCFITVYIEGKWEKDDIWTVMLLWPVGLVFYPFDLLDKKLKAIAAKQASKTKIRIALQQEEQELIKEVEEELMQERKKGL